jgi:acetyl esterase/lipase
MYTLASPIQHVAETSPPTLHVQGRHDQIAPVRSARRLHRALDRAGVPAVFVEYPWTGHAFDLLVPPLLGPAGQAALYDVERFLACVGAGERAGATAQPPHALRRSA